jgi:hypothetical protein
MMCREIVGALRTGDRLLLERTIGELTDLSPQRLGCASQSTQKPSELRGIHGGEHESEIGSSCGRISLRLEARKDRSEFGIAVARP